MKEDFFSFTRKKIFYNLIMSVILSLVPFLRLLSKNSDYLSQTLWAEDGLFTLCFKKSSILNCTTDGFSGYLQLLPRLTGLIASRFDPQYWALAINSQAIVIYFLITFFLFSYLGQRDIPFSTRFLIAGAPTLLAFSGSEIIGIIANDYLLLFYIALVYITFLNTSEERRRFKVSALVLFCILALSSPFGLVASLLLAIKIFINHRLKTNWLFLAMIAVANFIQIAIMINQIGKRGQNLNILYFVKEVVLNSLKSFIYIFYTPKSGDLLPGLSFSSAEGFIVLTFAILVLFKFRKSMSINLKENQRINSIIQITSFVSVLFISVLSNGAPIRYINLLILINILIFTTIFLNRSKLLSKRFAVTLSFFVILNLGISFQVSETRVSAPYWKDEWSKAAQTCSSELGTIAITFTPLWPTVNTHTYPMFEPLTNRISCQDLFQ
jgi:hypothetical protein